MKHFLVLMTLTGCAIETGTDDNLPAQLATLLADDNARTAIQEHVAKTKTGELSLTALREIQLPDGRVLADELHASLEDRLLVAPDTLANSFASAPWVTYVADTSAQQFEFYDAGGLVATLPRGEAPAMPFLTIRPRELATTGAVIAGPEPASLTGSLYIREIDVRNDREDGTDAEIYVRCKQGGGWKREDLESVNDSEHYRLWNKNIMSISTTGNDILCEGWEEDGFGNPDDYMGSMTIPAWLLEYTNHNTCFVDWIGSDAALWFSRSRGTSQCPEAAYLGIYCAEHCPNELH